MSLSKENISYLFLAAFNIFIAPFIALFMTYLLLYSLSRSWQHFSAAIFHKFYLLVRATVRHYVTHIELQRRQLEKCR